MMSNPLDSNLAKDRIAFLKESQWWDKSRLQAYQLEQLRDLLIYCQQRVPYYRALFKKHHINVFAEDIMGVLKSIPFLTKQDIQGRYDEFIPDGIDRSILIHRSTGGSTGTPLTVFADMDFLSLDKANTVFYMSIAGYDPFNFRSLRIYGDKVPEVSVAKGEFWYEKDNKLIVSCYHYEQSNYGRYFKAFNIYKPDYIHSRPSALLPLSQYLLDNPSAKQFNLGAIYLDGEFLNESQRDVIEGAWGCRVYNIYGHTEGCAVGVSCSSSRLLHFMPQVGIIELLDEQGKEVVEEDAGGELIVTGFNNRVFPLIRYRTFDMATHTNEACACGRHFRMIKSLQGRMQDFVVNRSGSLVPLAPAVFNYNDMDWNGIKQFQVYQEKVGVLLFKVVREPSAQETPLGMKERLLQAFDRIFNGTFDLSVCFVDEIQRTRIGKFRYLEQRLDIANYRMGISNEA